MENKINIAEILRDMPEGTKLYTPLFGEVKFDKITIADMICISSVNDNRTEVYDHFMKNGSFYSSYSQSECLLFPSKLMRDWSKFAWKKGDVLVSYDRTAHVIFEKFIDDTYTVFAGEFSYWKNDKNEDYYVKSDELTERFTLETEDAAKNYINAIEDRLGGKLNRETLEIEKQPEFNDGDIVVYGKSVAICRKIYKNTLYFYASLDEIFGLMFNQSVVSADGYRLATDSEKQHLFDVLKKEGKVWDAEKKQFVDLKPKFELKPFDKVLVRDTDDQEWKIELFSHYDETWKYICLGSYFKQCIPYEGNEHLLGTTNNPEKI